MFKYLLKRIIAIFYAIKYCKNSIIKISSTFLKVRFDGNNRVGKHCYFKKCNIGRHTCFGDNAVFYNSFIGSFCSFGSNVKLIWSSHPLHFSSTSDYFYKGDNSFFGEYKRNDGYCLTVGNDVWVGDNVLIKGGINIGDGAVIAFGSVVTKDVPPYAIVGGVPAQVIKYRFDEETISRFLHTKWWQLDEKKLKSLSTFINDPHTFLDNCDRQ